MKKLLKLVLSAIVPAVFLAVVVYIDDILAAIRQATGRHPDFLMPYIFFGAITLFLMYFSWGVFSGKLQSTSNGSPRASKDLDDDEPTIQA